MFPFYDAIMITAIPHSCGWTGWNRITWTKINRSDLRYVSSLHWRHNDLDGVWNHQPHVCLLNRLFRRRSKKTSKLRVTVLCVGNSPGPVNSPHKGPVTRNFFHLMTSSCFLSVPKFKFLHYSLKSCMSYGENIEYGSSALFICPYLNII